MQNKTKANWKKIVGILLICATVLCCISVAFRCVEQFLRFGHYMGLNADVKYFRQNKKDFKTVADIVTEVYEQEKQKNPQIERVYLKVGSAYSTEWNFWCYVGATDESEEYAYEVTYPQSAHNGQAGADIHRTLISDYHGDIGSCIKVTEDFVVFDSPWGYEIVRARGPKIPTRNSYGGDIEYFEVLTFGWYLIAY